MYINNLDAFLNFDIVEKEPQGNFYNGQGKKSCLEEVSGG